ncbi:hypothetical protein [Denitromonas iodatirespirans]|uniref:PilZ domain-containing protein n=1 Tax=Denitromonas iodatirespirans TaxID=2795389 RepID=A0A944HDG8_DENI1|nr:hypothetical protein [Denitromonas iodatirespirans]MBT0962006.1 hypothetical protein [Denitromonas iodatirespirans]
MESVVWNNARNDNEMRQLREHPMFLNAPALSLEKSRLLDEVRWRLQSLPEHEPGLALDEIAAGIELMLEGTDWSVHELSTALREFDESAQPVIRQAVKGFLQSAALGTGRGEVLHAASTRLFGAVVEAGHAILQRQRYAPAIQPDAAAEIAARLMRAETGRLKWAHLLYGPYDDALWQQMGAVFLEAEEDGRLMLPVHLRQGRDTETSTYREYLRAVALQCSGLEQMPVELVDVADRLILHLLPALHLGAGPVEGARFFVSPILGGAPRRLVKALSAEEPAWYFSPLLADRVLGELEAMLKKGVIPSGLGDGPVAKEHIAACIRHFRRTWYDTPAARRHRRHAMDGKLSAVRGVLSFNQILSGGTSGDIATWELRDVSLSGLGALAPVSEFGMPRIGELVAVRSEDAAPWRLGMVRRIQRGDLSRAFVGIETFALEPRVVRADDGRAPMEVLLCDPLRRGAQLRVVAPAGVLRSSAPLFVAEQGSIQKLKPIGAAWRGHEFEVRTYVAV